MSAKLLKINLDRFTAGKAISRDIFISLPLNGKMIRIAQAGDVLETAFLDKLKKRYVDSLFAGVHAGESEDPASLPLYLENMPSDSAENLRVTSAVNPAGEILHKHADVSGEGAASKSIAAPTEAEAEIFKLAKQSTSEDGTKLKAADASEEEVTRLAKHSSIEEVNIVKASPTAEEEIIQLAAERSPIEEVNVIKASGVAAEEEVTHLAAKRSPIEEINVIKASAAEEETVRVISGLRAVLDETIQTVARDAKILPSEELISLKTELEQCMANFSAASHGEQEEKTILGAGRDLETAIYKFESAPAAPVIPAVLALKAEVEKVTRELARRAESKQEAFKARLSDPTQEKHVSRIQPPTENGIENRQESLAQKKAPADAPLVDGQQSNFSTTHARAAVFKELPATAARMATYLAHSLGYVHLDYLSELALAVMLHFSRKDGKTVETEGLPPLIQSVLQARHSLMDSTVEDSLEIVTLLEMYFKNPECDRSLKDFSQRLFHSTLSELRIRPESVNIWNDARWVQFVEKGPSLDAHSLCSKATARAIKMSKEMAN